MKFNTTSGLHAALANVDILIDETYNAGAYTFSKDYGLQANSTLKVVQDGAVWRFDRLINPNYRLDWFTGALIEADVVLEDLITVIPLWPYTHALRVRALCATSGWAHSLLPPPLATSLVGTLVTTVETPRVLLLALPPSPHDVGPS